MCCFFLLVRLLRHLKSDSFDSSIVEVEVDGTFFAIASILSGVHEFATIDQIFA
jgi:hypothetical protein